MRPSVGFQLLGVSGFENLTVTWLFHCTSCDYARHFLWIVDVWWAFLLLESWSFK